MTPEMIVEWLLLQAAALYFTAVVLVVLNILRHNSCWDLHLTVHLQQYSGTVRAHTVHYCI